MYEKEEKKVRVAISRLIMDQIFFGSIATRGTIIIDPTCNTAYTNGRDYGFNPDFVNTQTPKQLEGLIAHEVMHVAWCHHLRVGKRDPKLINVAGDYCINLTLTEAGFKLPEGGLYDRRFAGMTMDEVYSILEKAKDEQEKKKKEEGESGEGEGGEGQPGQPGSGEGVPSDDPMTDGLPDLTDDNTTPGEEMGEVREATTEDGQAPSEAEEQMMENEVKIQTQQAVNMAKKKGNCPGSIIRMVEELVTPKINWIELLQKWMNDCSMNDYTFANPDRRMMEMGIVAPGITGDDLGEIAIVIDTSGSITPKELAEFGSELSAILEQFTVTCHVMYVDTRVAHYQEIDNNDLPLELEAKGGGGTAFDCVKPFMDEHGMSVKTIIYFTDMCLSDWGEEPDVPALAISTSGMGNGPDWLEVKLMA